LWIVLRKRFNLSILFYSLFLFLDISIFLCFSVFSPITLSFPYHRFFNVFIYSLAVFLLSQGIEILKRIPTRYQLSSFTLLFSMSDEGTSFNRLWSKIDDSEPTILLIRTSNDDVSILGFLVGIFCVKSIRVRALGRWGRVKGLRQGDGVTSWHTQLKREGKGVAKAVFDEISVKIFLKSINYSTI